MVIITGIRFNYISLVLYIIPGTMPFTEDFYLPSAEELKVEEIKLSTPFLKAGALHFGKYCDDQCKVRYILLSF